MTSSEVVARINKVILEIMSETNDIRINQSTQLSNVGSTNVEVMTIAIFVKSSRKDK